MNNLREFKPYLTQHKKLIINNWVNDENLKPIFLKYSLPNKFFTEHFADGIYEYMLGIIDEAAEPGACPVMNKLLQIMAQRRLAVSDVFLICTTFKNKLIDHAITNQPNPLQLVNSIEALLDKNLAGVISTYMEMLESQKYPFAKLISNIDRTNIPDEIPDEMVDYYKKVTASL